MRLWADKGSSNTKIYKRVWVSQFHTFSNETKALELEIAT